MKPSLHVRSYVHTICRLSIAGGNRKTVPDFDIPMELWKMSLQPSRGSTYSKLGVGSCSASHEAVFVHRAVLMLLQIIRAVGKTLDQFHHYHAFFRA